MSSTVPYVGRDLPPTDASAHFLWAYRPEGEGRYEVTGECPVCRCPMTKVWPYGQHTTAKGPFSRRQRPDADDGPWYTKCTCTSWHVNRPDGLDRGCGAGFWIAFPPNGLPQ
ncbi:hypothetical protein ABZ957_27125 [Streptomyces sp. NPDC046316]|uniref:hypothetical protein n=1 Tax=Streptomyces sp. NPDC046316 TaxID=3154494 RepID=UPI0033D68341